MWSASTSLGSLLTQEPLNFFYDKCAALSALKGKNHRKSCVSTNGAGGTILLHCGHGISGARARRNIYSPHSPSSPTLHHHHNQHHYFHDPMHSILCYSHPQQFPVPCSSSPPSPSFLPSPLQWIIYCLGLPITPLFSPFCIPCGSITAQNLGPRLKSVCFADTGKDDCGFYSLTGITKIHKVNLKWLEITYCHH